MLGCKAKAEWHNPPSDDAYRKPEQQAGLSDSRVSDQQELQTNKGLALCSGQVQGT